MAAATLRLPRKWGGLTDRAAAWQIVLDGEGATKLVEVRVIGAPNKDAAKRVAKTIAESPLVKTAFHGGDPNWGRIVAAAGRAGVAFHPDVVDLFIGDVPVQKVTAGHPAGDFFAPQRLNRRRGVLCESFDDIVRHAAAEIKNAETGAATLESHGSFSCCVG